jgi:signal peptidase I
MKYKAPTRTERSGPTDQWVEFFSLIKSLSIFLMIAFMLRASVVEAFKIPSSSMEPTLQVHDHILVNKLSYGLRVDPLNDESFFKFRFPKRGDVVVFKLPDIPNTPEDESEPNIIKRVIGLPGDEVMVRGTKVYINGEVYTEDDHYAQWVYGGKKDFGPDRVPQGRVLLLGDNRDQSRDSRFWADSPYLDVKRIKGRAFVIYWNWPPSIRRIFSVIR